jgi:Flp pilus assembly protein TadG
MSNFFRRLCDWQYRSSATQMDTSADRSESGSVLVEFTVLMPVLFLIFFGIIEFGLIFFFQNTMQSAAQVAARVVAVNGYKTSAQIKPFVCGWLMSNSMSGSLQFNVTTNDQSPATCLVQATITTSAAQVAVINYLNLIGGNITVAASMPKEYAQTGSCGTGGVVTFTCP